MIDIQQGLTSLISRLKSVIIRINFMLWAQDKMSYNAARNLWHSWHPSFPPIENFSLYLMLLMPVQ